MKPEQSMIAGLIISTGVMMLRAYSSDGAYWSYVFIACAILLIYSLVVVALALRDIGSSSSWSNHPTPAFCPGELQFSFALGYLAPIFIALIYVVIYFISPPVPC